MILSEDSFNMAILLHACPEHLVIDYSLHELARLDPPAQQVLLQRLERIAEPNEDELALLASLRHASS